MADEVEAEDDLEVVGGALDGPLEALERARGDLDACAGLELDDGHELEAGLDGDEDGVELGGELGLVWRGEEACDVLALDDEARVCRVDQEEDIAGEDGLEELDFLSPVSLDGAVEGELGAPALLGGPVGELFLAPGHGVCDAPLRSRRRPLVG